VPVSKGKKSKKEKMGETSPLNRPPKENQTMETQTREGGRRNQPAGAWDQYARIPVSRAPAANRGNQEKTQSEKRGWNRVK